MGSVFRLVILLAILIILTRSGEYEKHYQFVSEYSISFLENGARSYRVEAGNFLLDFFGTSELYPHVILIPSPN